MRQGTFDAEFIDVFFVDAQNGWALGQKGAIYHTDDGGLSWQKQREHGNETLFSIYFVNQKKGWAGGLWKTLHTEDGGRNWKEIPWEQILPDVDDAFPSANAFHFIDEKEGWMVGNMAINGALFALILHTQDGGKTWDLQYDKAGQNPRGIYFLNAFLGWAVGADGLILHTQDGGGRWKPQPSPPPAATLSEVYFANPSVGWTCGDKRLLNGSTVLVTLDGGKKWKVQANFPDASRIHAASFRNEKQGWTAEYSKRGGLIRHTEDGGKTWTVQTKTEDKLKGIHFVSPLEGWAVGEKGLMLHTQDGGQTWEFVSKTSSPRMYTVEFVDARKGWVGAKEELFFTRDGHTTWTCRRYDGDFLSVDFINENTGWAMEEASIKNTTDGGKRWVVQKTQNQLSAIDFVNAFEGWAVSFVGGIWHTSDGGRTWLEIRVDRGDKFLGGFFDLHFLDNREGWVVGTSGTIFHTTDGGKRWEKQVTPARTNLYGVHFPKRHDGWVVGADGTILYTEDRGKTWEKQDSSADADLFSVCFVDDKIGWAVGGKTAAGGFANFLPETAGGGAVLYTEDGGENWERQETNTTNCLWDICYSGSGEVWAVGDGGLILRYTDTSLPLRTAAENTEGRSVDSKEKLVTSWGLLKNRLYQNYPNPFNPETWIPFSLEKESEVTLRIYDVGGRLIRTLFLGTKPAGVYLAREKSIYWDGGNEDGEQVASGIYFYLLQASDFTAKRKMALLK